MVLNIKSFHQQQIPLFEHGSTQAASSDPSGQSCVPSQSRVCDMHNVVPSHKTEGLIQFTCGEATSASEESTLAKRILSSTTQINFCRAQQI